LDTYPNRYRSTIHDMRIVGLDDGAFHPSKKMKHSTLLVAVLFHKLRLLDIRVGRIEVDGRDANKVVTSLLRRLRYDAAMLSGISFGGFNVVDIAKLSKDLQRPVIVITGERPHNERVKKALREHFVDWRNRWRMVRSAGRIYSFAPLRNEPRLYFEVRGATSLFAKKAIASTARISRLPEPVRVARIVARGLSGLT
jgi:endonuclease V-like protein UPF0215 family